MYRKPLTKKNKIVSFGIKNSKFELAVRLITTLR